MNTDNDVIVIGGGPGGASCAAALARGGRRVLLLEKASFPRDHVGESLSPSVLDATRVLGAGEQLVTAGFAPKAGATFAWGDDPQPWTVAYPAANGPAAYQVRRAEFDTILLQAAICSGADVRLGWRVEDVEHSSGRPVAVLAAAPDGGVQRLAAPWVVDASGAPGLLAQRLGRNIGPAELDRIALWGYWRDSQPGEARSRHSLLVGRRDACLWHYPLDDRSELASIGVIVRGDGARQLLGGPPDGFYRAAVGACPELAPLVSSAVLEGEVRVADASAYASRQLAGRGWFLVGDAAFFVDPLLTPGIQLAMQSGTLAAQCLQTILDRPAAQAAALDLYDRVLRRDYDTFTWLSRNLYRAADTARLPEAGERGQAPEVDGQFAFLSLIAGLPKTELARLFGGYMGVRGKAAARSGKPVVPGEKEGFAFLTWVFRSGKLAEARADLSTPELDEDCVLLPAPNAAIAEELFVPSPAAQVLTSRTAARNRQGDRFEATPELVALFQVLGDGCPYEKAMEQFCEIAECHDEDCRPRFDNWIKLLADHGLIEWRPGGQGVT